MKKTNTVEAATESHVSLREEARPRSILSEESHILRPECELPPFPLRCRILRQYVRLLVDSEVTEVIFDQLYVRLTLEKSEDQRGEVLISNRELHIIIGVCCVIPSENRLRSSIADPSNRQSWGPSTRLVEGALVFCSVGYGDTACLSYDLTV